MTNATAGRDDDLAIPIARIMDTDVLTATADQSVEAVAVAMSESKVGSIVVVGARDELVGIFTERDVLNRVVAVGKAPATTPVGEVMTRNISALEADATMATAWDLIVGGGFRHAPVVGDGCLLGIVSMRTLLQARLRRVQALHEQEVMALQRARDLLELGADERVTQLVRVNERLESLALTDGLTGLFNYRYFMQRLAAEVARAVRHDVQLALVFADIDHFKKVNDTHGHAVGDRVLRHVARVLRSSVEGAQTVVRLRKSDIVARYGGEEFAVLLPFTAMEGAVAVAERIRSEVEASPLPGDVAEPIQVTISLGVAAYPACAGDEQALLRLADEALYLAKDRGRNRVECGAKTAFSQV